MNLGVQIVSFSVMLTIAFVYFTNKHIKLLSTRIYTLYLSVSLAYSFMEVFTIYTLYNINTVPAFFNRLAHQLFICTLVLILMFLFLYVDMLTRKQKRYKPVEFIVSILPAAFAFVMTAVGDIEYYVGSDGMYSYGPVVTVLYCCLGIYALWTVITLIRRRRTVPGHIMIIVLCGVLGWVVIGIVQMLNPTWLIESMGVSLMQLFIFLSIENPREYNDADVVGALNRHSFEMMLNERCENGKEFYVVTFTLTNSELLKNSVGVKEVYNILG